MVYIIKGIGTLMGLLIYPIIFLFRWKIKSKITMIDNKPQGKLFWKFLNLWINDDGSFIGNDWWRESTFGDNWGLYYDWTYIKKDLNAVRDEEKKYLTSFKLKFKYFIASYMWAAVRNGFYNYALYYAPIGSYEKIISIKSNFDDTKQMPRVWFMNADGKSTKEKGDYIDFNLSFFGWKIITWERDGKEHKFYGFTHYIKVFNKHLFIQAKYGRNWYDGQASIQCRTGIKKIA